MSAQAVRLTNVDIDNALKNKHFEVIFQPVFELKNGALARMEAFVRWVHPGLGMLPPGAFISFFETQGRMSELTRYVIETALEAYLDWRGKDGPGFSVNLALSDLSDEGFPDWLKETLLRHDFPAELITLECPSLPVTATTDEAQKTFTALKQTGARLAIEVRGRANDLMRNLSPFPFDEVKTGGSAILRFARTVRGGPGMGAISELLELAKANDAAIVAVGVEDQASLQALTSLGFTAAQGNHLAPVGSIKSFKANIVNDVRASLSLEPLDQDELLKTFETPTPTKSAAAKKPQPSKAVKKSEQTKPVEEEKPEASTSEATQEADDAERQASLLAEKKRKARELAKKRALKKAAEAKAAALKAKRELEEQQKQLKEAQAKRDVEDNARKLQDRLNRAYSEEDTGNEDMAKAGLLLGGSLATPVQRPTPQPKEKTASVAVTAPSEPELLLSVKEEQKIETGEIEAVNDTKADLPVEEIELTVQTEETEAEIVMDEVEDAEEISLEMMEEETCPEITTLSEEEIRSEDEVLDTVFADIVELPHDVDTGKEDPTTVDQTLLDQGLRDFGVTAPIREPRAKNFLQKRYRVRITGFWPENWRQQWAAKKLADDELGFTE